MKFRWLATLAAGLAVFGTAVHADQLADIKKKGELVVGVLGTDEPNSYIDAKTRELVGYEVDLGRAVAQKIGVKPVFKQITLAARIPELQQGHVDLLAASLTHNKEREAQIDFSVTTFVANQQVMVKANSPFKDVPDLAGKRVATAKGSSMEVNIKKAVPTVTVISYDTSPQALVAMLPALMGQLVVVIKDTALGYGITYMELLNQSKTLGSYYANTVPAYMVAAALFIILNYAMTKLAGAVETRLRKRPITAGPTTTTMPNIVQGGAEPGGPTDDLIEPVHPQPPRD